MPERSRVMTQTKRDTLVLLGGGLGMGLTTPHHKSNLFRNPIIQPRKDEKQMLTKEVWKSDLTMATWNVGTKEVDGEDERQRAVERLVVEEAKDHPGL
jgi:hypothetical protein